MEKEPYRFYIKTRTILGLSATAIHEELTTAYGPEAISYSTVQKWTKSFREGNMEIEDDPLFAVLYPKSLLKTFKPFKTLLMKTLKVPMTTLKQKPCSLMGR